MSPAVVMRALFRAIKWRPLAVVGALGLAIHAAILVRVSRPDALWSYFSLWVVSPALATLALGLALPRSLQSFWFCLCAALPLLLGLVMYVSMRMGPPDAQAGLTFLFTPIWQWIAVPIALILGAIPGLNSDRDD